MLFDLQAVFAPRAQPNGRTVPYNRRRPSGLCVYRHSRRQGLFIESHQGNNNILAIIDYFTRDAIAISHNDQLSSVIIFAIISNLITVYGTPRSILTVQSKKFWIF